MKKYETKFAARVCERCHQIHYGTYASGRFCSEHCAKAHTSHHSFPSDKRGDWTGKCHSEQTKDKMRKSALRLWREDRPHKFRRDENGRFKKAEVQD